jgi:hypothetical protein
MSMLVVATCFPVAGTLMSDAVLVPWNNRLVNANVTE